MTKEYKELLLRDLCARLPYGVKCLLHYTFNNETTDGEDVDTEDVDTVTKIEIPTNMVYTDWCGFWSDIDDCKPYLRPMSSMTEEEKRELQSFYPGSFGNQWLDIEEGKIEVFECSSTVTLYLIKAIKEG